MASSSRPSTDFNAAIAGGELAAADVVGHHEADTENGGDEVNDAADWALARIVRRRKHRGPVGSFDPDVDAEDMRWEYLCAWEGHEEVTWERRAWLQDYGFGDRVAAFDAERAPVAPSSTTKLRPTMPPRRDLAEQEARARAAAAALGEKSSCETYLRLNNLTTRVATEAEKLDSQWRELMGIFFRNSAGIKHSPFDVLREHSQRFPSGVLPDDVRVCDVPGLSSFLLTVLLAFSCDSSYCLEALAPVAPRSLASFADDVKRTGVKLRVVFYGTRADAVEAVVDRGLQPSHPSGPQSSNHSSDFGVGVYAGTRLGSPHCYNSGHSDTIFACLAAAEGPGVESNGGDHELHVVADEHLIVPMLKLRVGQAFLGGDNNARCVVFRDGQLFHFFNPRVHSR